MPYFINFSDKIQNSYSFIVKFSRVIMDKNLDMYTSFIGRKIVLKNESLQF